MKKFSLSTVVFELDCLSLTDSFLNNKLEFHGLNNLLICFLISRRWNNYKTTDVKKSQLNEFSISSLFFLFFCFVPFVLNRDEYHFFPQYFKFLVGQTPNVPLRFLPNYLCFKHKSFLRK